MNPVRPDAALRRPLFWVALGTLLLNDHVLKGAGILPGAITGKLSDVAGLAVAPVVLAALLRVKTRRGAGLAMAATGIAFAAINLFEPVAGVFEVALGWRVWTDPTDLVTLPALALAWGLMVDRRAARAPKVVTYAALGLGVFACMATSQDSSGLSCSTDRDCPSDYGELACCGGTCVDMEFDRENCGGCGVACGDGEACNLGRCEAASTMSFEGAAAVSAPWTVAPLVEEGPAGALDAHLDREQDRRGLGEGRVVVSNATRALQAVQVSAVADPAALDCALLATDPEAAAPPAAFDAPVERVLTSFDHLTVTSRAACDAYWVSHHDAGSALLVVTPDAAPSLVRLVDGPTGHDWAETEGEGALAVRR